MGYEFEWDARKAAANLRKHGLSFEEAATAFADPLALNMPDPAHSAAEARYVVLGQSTQGHLLVVCYTDRPPQSRLITARPATRRERIQYEEGQTQD